MRRPPPASGSRSTVETFADLLQNKRALRVEWYIVILIVIEIVLTLYQLLFLGKH